MGMNLYEDARHGVFVNGSNGDEIQLTIRHAPQTASEAATGHSWIVLPTAEMKSILVRALAGVQKYEDRFAHNDEPENDGQPSELTEWEAIEGTIFDQEITDIDAVGYDDW